MFKEEQNAVKAGERRTRARVNSGWRYGDMKRKIKGRKERSEGLSLSLPPSLFSLKGEKAAMTLKAAG